MQVSGVPKKFPVSHEKVPEIFLSCRAVSKQAVLFRLSGAFLWDRERFLGHPIHTVNEQLNMMVKDKATLPTLSFFSFRWHIRRIKLKGYENLLVLTLEMDR